MVSYIHVSLPQVTSKSHAIDTSSVVVIKSDDLPYNRRNAVL